jgi:hypothetical protein
MSKHRRGPSSGRPRLKVSDWRYVGLYRYDHKGRRQATRIEPRYAHPSQWAKVPPSVEGYKMLVAAQAILAASLGLKNKDLRDAAEHVNNRPTVQVGSMLPHRKRAVEAGFAEAGMTHLLG